MAGQNDDFAVSSAFLRGPFIHPTLEEDVMHVSGDNPENDDEDEP